MTPVAISTARMGKSSRAKGKRSQGHADLLHVFSSPWDWAGGVCDLQRIVSWGLARVSVNFSPLAGFSLALRLLATRRKP